MIEEHSKNFVDTVFNKDYTAELIEQVKSRKISPEELFAEDGAAVLQDESMDGAVKVLVIGMLKGSYQETFPDHDFDVTSFLESLGAVTASQGNSQPISATAAQEASVELLSEDFGLEEGDYTLRDSGYDDGVIVMEFGSEEDGERGYLIDADGDIETYY